MTPAEALERLAAHPETATPEEVRVLVEIVQHVAEMEKENRLGLKLERQKNADFVRHWEKHEKARKAAFAALAKLGAQ